MKERAEALSEVREAHQLLASAKKNYTEKIVRAKHLEITNAAIARVLGITETAVRLHYKRWTEKKVSDARDFR